MKKDGEIKLLLDERGKGVSQRLAAARAGMSERTARKYEGAGQLPSQLRRPRTHRTREILGTHDGYVSWEEFERLQATISANVMRSEQIGTAQRGPALLAGLLRCRRCGHKLAVHYTGSHHGVLRYHCRRGWLDNGAPRCIGFAGLVVDQAIAREILRVIQPAAIEAAVMAHEEQARKVDEVLAALQRDLEATQYSARRAQFDAVNVAQDFPKSVGVNFPTPFASVIGRQVISPPPCAAVRVAAAVPAHR